MNFEMSFWCLRFDQKTKNFLRDFFPSLLKEVEQGKVAFVLNYLIIIQLGTFLFFSFRISIMTKIKTLKFSISHFVFSHRNKHLRTLNNLLDMATGYANCSLGCDDLQHILNHPITIKSVMRIAPGIKTQIAKSLLLGSIFGFFCIFLGFLCLFGFGFWLSVPFFRCVFFSLFGTVLKPSKERMFS